MSSEEAISRREQLRALVRILGYIETKAEAAAWHNQWFVEPNLNRVAVINEATGHDPKRKFWHNQEYICKQSFWFALKIVIRQVR